MKEVVSINILCPGNWNKRIFTPNWVSTNLFGLGPNIQFHGIVNTDEMEFGYTHKDVLLLPKDNVLEIKLDKINDGSKAFAGVLLKRILSLLPHTPIKAVGINISYSFIKTENYQIVEALNQINCKLSGFRTNQIKFFKNLDDCQLNIITDISDKFFIVNFNYHYIQINKLDENIINSRIADSKSIIENE
ncbi:MAG: hypothetical protein B6D64_09240 [Bacteroidetes bacterium 4484_276]|nr:MAG: hypothetical protein B6D64_09240 [Bacteroidetes bacterium 4484_276]